jgi:signal transduction histidine kinase
MHEIRNPLETLANLNYLVRQAADDADQVREYARQAEEQIQTLSRIATQTLGFARLRKRPKPSIW